MQDGNGESNIGPNWLAIIRRIGHHGCYLRREHCQQDDGRSQPGQTRKPKLHVHKLSSFSETISSLSRTEIAPSSVQGSLPDDELDRADLEPRSVNDLVVNGELATAVVDDQDANATAAVAEDIVEPVPEPALIDDGQALLDVARLGHGHDAAVVADVEHAILLEDGSEHVLHHDRRRRVRDEARLLVQLLREEIDAEVAVLARLVRDGDADDLARPALEDQEIAEADVVARDRDGVGRTAALDDADALAHGPARTRAIEFVVEMHLLTHGAAMMVRVQQAIDAALEALAERVVMAVVVVVTHLRSVVVGKLYGCSDVRGPVVVVLVVLGLEVVFKVDRRTVVHPSTILALGDVDLRLGQVGTMAVATSGSEVGVRVGYRVSVDLDVSFRVRSRTTLDVDVGLGASP